LVAVSNYDARQTKWELDFSSLNKYAPMTPNQNRFARGAWRAMRRKLIRKALDAAVETVLLA
jgi:hypothetical protein